MDDQASELEALERILIDKSAEPIRLSYAVVKHITNNFSQEVGRGGFGVVYLGVLPRGKVAVKKLIMSQDFSDEHFIEEVRCLFRAKHKNIVKFLGYCSATEGELIQVNGRYHLADIRHRLLCFEYAPNGNLHSYLKEKCYEDEWNIRYKILKGICQGLDCLHKERINHLDLKPENVLLDAHMEPKITDFGLSRCFDEKQSRIFTQTLRGTVGYIAPELIDKGEISFKSDIFSLGIIMIKLLTGHNEYDIDNWHESISIDCPQIKRCIEVARLCVDSDQYSRPSIAEIINKLDKETMIPMVPLAINELKNDPRLSLYKENIPSFKEIVQEWDECFVYPEFYNNCTQEPTNLGDKSYLDLRTKASQGAVVSSGILRADENDTEFIEVDDTILDTYHTIEDNKTLKFDVPYNILPLNATSNDNAIRRYPEIRETVYALQNIRGLQWTNTHDENNDKIHTGNDLFDWLQATFRFQKDNASNQREHLILLLANVQIRQTPLPDQELKLDDRALDVVMKKLFKNYKKWCKYLGRESNLRLPTTQREAQQHKILYMGLYLLIWGEAANLRFMPECLCYIYHHMAFELYGMLAGHVSPFTGGYVKPAYGGEDEAFLMNVVTPIHKVIEKEAERSMAVKSNDHSYWRNYDDLNEYFWSNDCSQLGWPMRADADFFRTPKDNMPTSTGKVHWMGKVNFVEIRSFLHVFLSFDRMWVFLILSLQAMIIIAWNDGTLGDIFEIEVFKKVLSIFITAALLNLGQAFLVIVFCWKARRSMSTAVKLRYVLKLISAITWVLILPATYAYTSDNPSSLENIIKYLFGDNHNLSLYIMAVLIYLIPNMLAALLLIFPFLRKFLESSEVKVIVVMMWWSEPCLFVGRNMHESAFSVLKYTVFWVTVLAMKFTVNFYVEIKPLVQPTKDILGKSIQTFQCQDFCPYANNKIGVLFAFWAPIVLVYFMDIQIWFALFSTLVGGIYGDYHGLGEIQTLGMFRSRFESFVGAFNKRLIPCDAKKRTGFRSAFFSKPKVSNDEKQIEKIDARLFTQTWNKIITCFREEDLINNSEKLLLLVPPCEDHEPDIIQWPLFLLASKIPTALDTMVDSDGEDYHDLKKKMGTDLYLSSAIRECYDSFRNIISALVFGQPEKKIIQEIFKIVEKHMEEGTLIKKMNLRNLPTLSKKFIELLQLLLKNSEEDIDQVVILFQDIIKVVTRDIMMELDQLSSTRDSIINAWYTMVAQHDQLFTKAIEFPVKESNGWTEKINRLHLLLTLKESDVDDVPRNLDARQRILFFANSLFMEIPNAPKVQAMLPFSVLTPYYNDDILLSSERLKVENEDGISIIFYLQKMYPDEWKNFLERVHSSFEDELWGKGPQEEDLRLWASYRMQTLSRTVRGMMYYRKALEFQAFLDIAKDEDLSEDNGATKLIPEESKLITQCQAIADMKFTYVVTCHIYGKQKRIGDPRAQDILTLLRMYPSLRIAYVDEVEAPSQDRNEMAEKVYYSCLVKASDHCHDLDQEIYRIKLPGNPFLGVGKQENQNHAVIFTRGECLQTIAMNQDNYMEEALKMRNLLQEFLNKRDGVRYPSILGLRERIFPSRVSSLAWFMSNQENSFVTIGQRVLANLLRVRFHYGGPDIFDRFFHITRGGFSKASKFINYFSDGIFAGFNSTLREGSITHHEYLQVGRGMYVGLDQILLGEAVKASSNGQQTLSRDIYRLGQGFDFFRMLSCYYTTIGSYFNTMITVWTIYFFLYGRLYLVLSGLQEALTTERRFVLNAPLQFALVSESFMHLGFFIVLPMIMEISLERGPIAALCDFLLMQLQLASVFFAFSLGTKTHYYGKTLLHGAVQHRATGRGIPIFHVKFSENYRRYSRSHFVKAIEMMALLVVHEIFGQPYKAETPYILITISLWFMVGAWLFAPFLFNPSGFEWQKMVDDWTDWNKWIHARGGVGVAPEISWESWWQKEQESLRDSGKCGAIVEILLALRFFTYQYGLAYKLNIAKHVHSIMVHGFSLVALYVILLILKTESIRRRRFSADFQLAFLVVKCIIFVRFVYILANLIGSSDVTVLDISVFILGFIPTGWGLLLIAQAIQPALVKIGLWRWIKVLARGYDILMGLVLFAPIAFFAWLPFVSGIQGRLLFNHAFSRGLLISLFLGGYGID